MLYIKSFIGDRNRLEVEVGDDQDLDASIEVTNLDSPEPLPVATKRLTVAKGIAAIT